MKKFLSILCFTAFCAIAWVNVNASDIDVNKVKKQIAKLELIETEAFQWESLEYGEPTYNELTKYALEVYTNNKRSFNAAYNYGVIRYDAWEPEMGPITEPDVLNEALEAFKKAKELVPNKIMLLQREYDVLYLLLVGNDVPFSYNSNEDLFKIYQNKHNQKNSEEMFSTIKRLFELNGYYGLNQIAPYSNDRRLNYENMALQAFLIKLAQKDYNEAKKWIIALDWEKELKGAWQEEYKKWRNSLGKITSKQYKAAWKKEYGQGKKAQYLDALNQIGIDTSNWVDEILVGKKICKLDREVSTEGCEQMYKLDYWKDEVDEKVSAEFSKNFDLKNNLKK